jgi:carbonic anhydrase
MEVTSTMSDTKLSAKSIAKDFLAGTIVFLVALPLCLGIAIASDADPIAGLISGIVGGLIIAIFSGSHTSVSGPAAGLTAIVAAQIANLQSYEAFLLAVVVGGVIQIGFGLLKAGALSAFFPSSVIKGLLAAIGVILVLKQLPLLFGYTKDMGLLSGQPEALGDVAQPTAAAVNRSHEIGDIIFSFFNAMKDVFTFDGGLQLGAISVGVFSLFFLIIWDKIPRLKKSLVPAPLLVVIFGTGLGTALSWIGDSWLITPQQLVDVPGDGTLGGFVGLIRTPDFSQLANVGVYVGGITIAVVASLETLLNLDAVDKLDRKRRISPPNQELLAQGIGNVAAGMLGGIPVTSVAIRGSVNVMAGSETKLSAIFHGALLLGSVVLMPQVLAMIPLSCLAAILLMTGFKLASPALFREMASAGRYQFLPFVVTVVAIVCIGMVLSVLFILNSNLRRPVRKIREKHIDGDLLHIELSDQVSFLNKAALESAMRETPRGSRLLLDARRTHYIDPDVLSLIREFRDKTAPAFGITMQMVGFREKYKFSGLEDTVDFSLQEAREKLTADQVLGILKAGNKRFVEGHPLDRSLLNTPKTNRKGLRAITVIVGGTESSPPVETIFDLGMGEAFVVRMPGAVVGPRAIGGVEHAVSVGGAKLVVLMGHTDSSLLSLAMGVAGSSNHESVLAECVNLQKVLEQIAVSMDAQQARDFAGMAPEEQQATMDQIVRRHITRMAQQVVEDSPLLKRLVTSRQIQVVTAIYDTSSGSVEFLNESHVQAVDETFS